MKIKKIKELTRGWHTASWKVIDFKNPGLNKIYRLFKETYEIVEEFSKEKLIPKELCGLLLEMRDFGWWVSNLDDTPLHCFYKNIVSLVCDINKYFLTLDADTITIKNSIEELNV